MVRGMPRLVFMLLMFQYVSSNELDNAFLKDILSNFKLTSPTILFDSHQSGEVLEICKTRQWVLCLDQTNEQNEMALHLAMLYEKRRQDSVIFLGNDGDLVRHVAALEPSMFRSSSPIFLPVKLSDVIDLKLDSNIIFFEKKDSQYMLIDKFSVKGSLPLVSTLGTWMETTGLQLERRINRWERRSDLRRMTFHNTLSPNGRFADFIFDEDNTTIIGSKGWFQEKLFYITEALNLTVTIFEDEIIVDGKPRQHYCTDLLLMNLTDVCSQGIPIFPKANWSYSMPTDRQPQTLLAGVPTGTAPHSYVYMEIFGFLQWIVFLCALIIISLAMQFSHYILKENNDDRMWEGFVTPYLFLLQKGNHPETSHFSKRLLSFTTSILTLLMFIYYSNDITSKMTAGSAPISVRTFDDVINLGYKVIIVGEHHLMLLAESKEGSAKHDVYKLYFEEDHKKIKAYYAYERLVTEKDPKMTQEAMPEKPKWFDWTKENLVLAEKMILEDEKTLFYCASTCVGKPLKEGKVVALDMDDTFYTLGGFALRTDSEFLSVFNHYLLKAFQSGILKRLDMKWNVDRKSPIKIGITKPEPLGINNIMFPFACLAVAIIISVAMSVIEKVVKKVKVMKSNLAAGGVAFVKQAWIEGKPQGNKI